MDGHRLLSRRTMLAATAVGAIPATGVAWHLLSTSPGPKSSAADDQSAPRAVRPTDTWNPLIRVNLTPDNIDEVTISVDTPFRIVVPGNPRVLAQLRPVREIVVSAAGDGTGIRFGDTVLPASQIEIVSVGDASIWVGRRLYRGIVRIYRRPGQRIMAVNVLPLEEYLASVVNSEMPASFSGAARQAQSIVARTYALTQMKAHPQFDLYNTTRSQMYFGYQYLNDDGRPLAGETSGSRQIIRDTAGIVCTYQGKIFTTWYSAVCGGRTLNGRTVFSNAVPALRSVECDWCREAQRYRWNSDIPIDVVKQAVQKHLSGKGSSFGTLKSLQPIPGTPGDLPWYLVSDGTSQHRIAGTTLRRSLPPGALHSAHYSAEVAGNTVKFSGRGDGHGVGLCQWGASGLGKAGRSALQILRYYYSGIETVRLQTPGSPG